MNHPGRRTIVISFSAILCCVSLLVCAQSFGPSAQARSGAHVLTFFSEFDYSDQPYALYLPKDFSPTKKYPLVVALHGAGSNHRGGLRRVFGVSNGTDSVAGVFPALPDIGFIVAAPLARGSLGYLGVAEQDVYDMLAEVMRRFPIDEDRVYLTGESMGGSGTLWLGLSRPDVWAAIAPVCGGAPAGVEELAPNALNLPVHLTHGGRDQTVPVEIARRWRAHFTRAEVALEYQEYPNLDHNVWDVTYQDGAIFEWFGKHRRNRFPARVRFVTPRYQHRAAYWLEFDALTPGTLAQIDARFTGKNRLEVTTEKLAGFTLKLTGHPMFDAREAVAVKLDGVTLEARGQTLSFSRHGAGWQLGRVAAPVGAKRAGLEGPISAAVAARHVYVYGTDGAPSEAELHLRRAQAALAADWAGPFARPAVSFQVLADSELKDGGSAPANLVLFGTQETNRVLARWAGQLPLALKTNAPEAKDYGLLFIAPVQDKYALVSSGLAWWVGGEQAERARFRWQWMSLPYRLLLSFGDFVLFKGSITNVVVEGRFDSQWKVRPAEAAQLRATGVVEVR